MNEQLFILSLIGYGTIVVAGIWAAIVVSLPRLGMKASVDSQLAWLLLLTGCGLLTIAIGFRPEEIGSDTVVYAEQLSAIEGGQAFDTDSVLYPLLVKAFTHADMKWAYFPTVAFVSIFGLAYVSRRFYSAPEVVLISFLWISSPFFWGLSANVIRQGLSLVFALNAVFAIYRNRRVEAVAFAAIACGLHASSLILVLTALTTRRVSLRTMVTIWLGVVVVAFVAAPTRFLAHLEPYAQAIGLGHYFNQYIPGENSGAYEVGFKWRFMIFSALPIVAYLLLGTTAELRSRTTYLMKIYLANNALACLFFNIPFHDRLFLQSWSLLPFLVYAVIAKGSLRKALVMAPMAGVGVWSVFDTWTVGRWDSVQ